MLNRNLAPITDEAWGEIDNRAEEVLKTYLSARRVVKVNGPKGWDYNVLTEGRLNVLEQNSKVNYGIYNALPLVESRAEFEIDRWELDNLMRGAKDVDLSSLEEAMKELALFEENAIYYGLKNANIVGLVPIAKDEIVIKNESSSILEGITKGVLTLKESFTEGPYTLIVGEKVYKAIKASSSNYPLEKKIKDLIDGNIVYSHVLDEAILAPYDHDDLEMTIGNDFSIGYQNSDNKSIRFYATESFTFRVLDPDIIIKFSMK